MTKVVVLTSAMDQKKLKKIGRKEVSVGKHFAEEGFFFTE